MSFRAHPSPSAYECLQEWRRLERRLAELVPDDPERAGIARELERVRRRYLELFDGVSNGVEPSQP